MKTMKFGECEVARAAYQRGREDAAEAVERVSSLLQPLGPALAAIDALKGMSE